MAIRIPKADYDRYFPVPIFMEIVEQPVGPRDPISGEQGLKFHLEIKICLDRFRKYLNKQKKPNYKRNGVLKSGIVFYPDDDSDNQRAPHIYDGNTLTPKMDSRATGHKIKHTTIEEKAVAVFDVKTLRIYIPPADVRDWGVRLKKQKKKEKFPNNSKPQPPRRAPNLPERYI